MDDGAITHVAGDRAETLFDEVLAFCAELMQFLHEAPFGLCLPIGKSFLFEPFEEARECGCILAHGDAFAFQFDGILFGLVDEDG